MATNKEAAPKRKTSLLDWSRLSSTGFASFAASLSNNEADQSGSNMTNKDSGKEKQSPSGLPPNSGSFGSQMDTTPAPFKKGATFGVRGPRDVVRKGWLLKRGNHIKNWRRRFFVLFRDGTLLGFKTDVGDNFDDPLNDFTIKDAQVMLCEKPKPYTFIIRGLQWTSITERIFAVTSPEERELWAHDLMTVAAEIKRKSVSVRGFVDVASLPMDAQDIPADGICRPSTSDLSSTGLTVADAGKQQEQEEMEAMDCDPTTKTEEKKDAVITLNSFEFLKVLGKGTFGKVILGKEYRTNRLYAIKILKKEVILAKDELQHTMTENRVLQRCRHPFLTELTYSFQTIDRLCFVMEFAIGGDLYYHLNQEVQTKKEGFSEEKTRFYGSEIVLALGYLHQNNIVYRDLKLENLLLDRYGHIKIADFGLCKEEISYNDRTRTFCGTPEYLAPEVLEDNDYGRAVDWWGVGVVMYEMICGRLPFYSKEHDRLFQMILSGNIRYPTRMSDAAKDLLTKLLIKVPSQRLGGGPNDAAEITGHPFFYGMDFEALLRKEIEPPFIPNLASDTDTSYFDAEFTREAVQLTPPAHKDGSLAVVSELEEMQQNFVQFSFHNIYKSPEDGEELRNTPYIPARVN